jgi:cytochrome P450
VEASRTPSVFTSGPGATSIADLPPEFLEFYGSMINADDPRHARLRRIVSRGFTPRRLAGSPRRCSARPPASSTTCRRGRRGRRRGISARLPLKIVCDMMGVPESQYDFVYRTSNVILGASDPEYVPDADNIVMALLQAGNELAELMRDLGPAPHRAPHRRRHLRAGERGDRRRESSRPTSWPASSSCSSWPATRPPATPSAGA